MFDDLHAMDRSVLSAWLSLAARPAARRRSRQATGNIAGVVIGRIRRRHAGRHRRRSPTRRRARCATPSPAPTASTRCRCSSRGVTTSRRRSPASSRSCRRGSTVSVGDTSRVGREAGGRRRRRERHGLGRDAAGRDLARHARHHHRSAEGRRAAAERPQLHAARHAHPRRGRAAGRPRRRGGRRDAGRLRRRHRRVQRQRHAQPVEQLPARRREQQRHLQHRLRDAAAARRDPGIQDPDPLLQRRVRPQRRIGRQRRDQGGHQRSPRRGLGVQPRRHVPGAQLLRARSADAEAEAEPVRRQPRRADHEEQAVRLRLLRGLPQHPRQHQNILVADRCAAAR